MKIRVMNTKFSLCRQKNWIYLPRDGGITSQYQFIMQEKLHCWKIKTTKIIHWMKMRKSWWKTCPKNFRDLDVSEQKICEDVDTLGENEELCENVTCQFDTGIFLNVFPKKIFFPLLFAYWKLHHHIQNAC